MSKLSKGQTIRFSEKEILYFNKLKEIGFNPSHFVRLAFREKINREYKTIEKQIKEKKERVYCPF
jgi:hypothetical protein